jgi:class 3 adenylate cyclase
MEPVRQGAFADRGFLVLADISGFTALVTATELEHGPQITAELLEGVLEQLSPPLEIQEVEGDAVFALGSDRVPLGPASLLDLFGNAFVAFRTRQREMLETPTCACGACDRISALNLKIVAHYGRFLRHTVGGRGQAAGSDVILAHRLLKNRVNWTDGYLLLTEAALQRLGLDPMAVGLGPTGRPMSTWGRSAASSVTWSRCRAELMACPRPPRWRRRCRARERGWIRSAPTIGRLRGLSTHRSNTRAPAPTGSRSSTSTRAPR